MAVDAGTIFVVYQYQGIVMTLVSIMLKVKVKRKNLREKGHTNSLRYNILLKWRQCMGVTRPGKGKRIATERNM
jgi:hypothetical protein